MRVRIRVRVMVRVRVRVRANTSMTPRLGAMRAFHPSGSDWSERSPRVRRKTVSLLSGLSEALQHRLRLTLRTGTSTAVGSPG